jgi:hypothetical protein
MLLEPNEFLTALGELYSSQEAVGSVKLQFKRSLGAKVARKKRKIVTAAATEAFCLVRASTSKKSISAEISQAKAAEFQNKLGAVFRNHLASCVKA